MALMNQQSRDEEIWKAIVNVLHPDKILNVKAIIRQSTVLEFADKKTMNRLLHKDKNINVNKNNDQPPKWKLKSAYTALNQSIDSNNVALKSLNKASDTKENNIGIWQYNEHKQTNDDYHAKLLPTFEMYLNQNMKKRVSLTIDIINSNKHISNKFQIPLNFLNKSKEIIKSSISNMTRYDSPVETLEKYKEKALKKLHKHKPRFFGDYIFEPIIYNYLFKYIRNIYSSLSISKCMIIFIDIFINILESVVKLNGTIRNYPLIPYTLIKMNTKFKQSSMDLLKRFNLDISEEGKTSKDLFFNFIERLKDIKNICANRLNLSNVPIAQLMKKEQNSNDNNHISQNPKNNYKKQTTDNQYVEDETPNVKVKKLKTMTENEHKTMEEEIIKVAGEILNQRETEEKSEPNGEQQAEEDTITHIFNHIFQFLFHLVNFWTFFKHKCIDQESDQKSQATEKQCTDLLEKYELGHIWPTLCTKGFNDMSLWKDITSDMLDKMNVADPDKIRFEWLKKHLKHSEKSLIGKIMENGLVKMCSKNPKVISGLMTSIIGPIVWWIWSKTDN